MSDQAGDITMDVSSTSTSGQGPILSRRTALIGGSAVLGGVLISLSTPPNNATAAAALPRIILGGTSLGYFDEGHTAAGMWTMPSTLSVHASPLELQRAVISVTWDSRMADVTSSEIIIASDDTTAIVEAVVSPGSIQFAWPSTVKWKSQQRYFECILPIRGKPLFPNDGLSGVVPGQASLDLRNRRTPIVVSTDGQDAAVHGEVWGASISALGASFEDGGNASYARVVRIESTGPGAIPAGSALVLAVDSARVSALTLSPAPADDVQSLLNYNPVVESTRASMRRLHVSLANPIPAGEVRRLYFDAVPHALTAGLNYKDALVLVTFEAPPGADTALQRRTSTENIAITGATGS